MGWILGAFIAIIAGLTVVAVCVWCDLQDARAEAFNLRIANRRLKEENSQLRATYGVPLQR